MVLGACNVRRFRANRPGHSTCGRCAARNIAPRFLFVGGKVQLRPLACNGLLCNAPSAQFTIGGNCAMAMRPRRSVLYVPGDNERALEKAKTLPAIRSSSISKTRSRRQTRMARRHAISVVREGRGFGTSRSRPARQSDRDALGHGRSARGHRVGAGCHTHSEGFLPRRRHRHGQGRQGRRGSAEHSALGDDRNADGNHQCA